MADTIESYLRFRCALSHSSKGRLLVRNGIFLLNRRELRHGKFWPIRRQMRIRYCWKVLMGQKEAAGLYKLAVCSIGDRVHRESTPTEYTERVHRESTPRVHRHSGRENRQESAVHIEWDKESLRIGW